MQRTEGTDGASRDTTSAEVFEAYTQRSWRASVERQRGKGLEFVIGRRDGAYLWNLENTHRMIDCGTGGGVHSLGHRHPKVLSALHAALDGGHDAGLWSFPNVPYLQLQDLLARLAPSRRLDRSVVTLSSTASIDLALMSAFRVTGRQKLLAYQHGYHGHTGFAALATGSEAEGVVDYYNLPPGCATFAPRYNSLAAFEPLITADIAAVIIEPMDYETFGMASAEFLHGVARLCRERGALFILDETRTGLGRTGRLWAAEHFDIEPDMLITGKGLSGGLYPVSAVLMTQDAYDRCLNAHTFAYISSLGGNEVACLVAQKVLQLSAEPALLENVNRVGAKLWKRLQEVAARHSALIKPGESCGLIQTLEVRDPRRAKAIYRAFCEAGVYCHSVSIIDPVVIKFFPPLTITESIVEEIGDAVDLALRKLAGLAAS